MPRPGLALRVVAIVGALALGTLLVLWLVPSSDYILLPDRAKPVEPLVSVPNEGIKAGKGGIYYVDVLVRRATILEKAIPGLHDGSTIVPAHAINPPGVSDSQRRQADLGDMTRSQDVAAAVALRELGYKVETRPTGVLVGAVGAAAPALGKLHLADLITEVDGRSVLTVEQLRAAMKAKRPGDSVTFGVRRGSQPAKVTVRTISAPDNPRRAIAGFAPEQGSAITLPVPVRIDAGQVGGPSAGLAFALDVVDELGRDVDRGNIVAATGEIFLDGTVGPVGGIEQKTIGARRVGAQVFLVPAGDNAAEARRFAGGMRVVPVESFRQALSALATLPVKP